MIDGYKYPKYQLVENTLSDGVVASLGDAASGGQVLNIKVAKTAVDKKRRYVAVVRDEKNQRHDVEILAK